MKALIKFWGDSQHRCDWNRAAFPITPPTSLKGKKYTGLPKDREKPNPHPILWGNAQSTQPARAELSNDSQQQHVGNNSWHLHNDVNFLYALHANLSRWGNQDRLQWLGQRAKRTNSNQTTSSMLRLHFQKVRFQFISLLVYFLCISSLPHSDHKDKHNGKLAEQEQILRKNYQSTPRSVSSRLRKVFQKSHKQKQNTMRKGKQYLKTKA